MLGDPKLLILNLVFAALGASIPFALRHWDLSKRPEQRQPNWFKERKQRGGYVKELICHILFGCTFYACYHLSFKLGKTPIVALYIGASTQALMASAVATFKRLPSDD